MNQNVISASNAVRASVLSLMRSALGAGRHSQVVDEIAEGRARDPKYHWCADAVTWAISRSGVGDEDLLNRADVRGKWTPQIAMSTILTQAKSRGALIGLRDAVPGDIYTIKVRNGWHIGFITSTSQLAARQFSTIDGNTGLTSVVGVNVRPSDRTGVGQVTAVVDTARLVLPYFARLAASSVSDAAAAAMGLTNYSTTVAGAFIGPIGSDSDPTTTTI